MAKLPHLLQNLFLIRSSFISSSSYSAGSIQKLPWSCYLFKGHYIINFALNAFSFISLFFCCTGPTKNYASYALFYHSSIATIGAVLDTFCCDMYALKSWTTSCMYFHTIFHSFYGFLS